MNERKVTLTSPYGRATNSSADALKPSQGVSSSCLFPARCRPAVLVRYWYGTIQMQAHERYEYQYGAGTRTGVYAPTSSYPYE
eukprot:scaffold206477_cov17-Prasinocladus_malaysianus.AAC.1